MVFWSDKSSALSIGVTILSTVRKAARLAVYDEIIISVKNHQIPPTMRVDAALGFKSDLKYMHQINESLCLQIFVFLHKNLKNSTIHFGFVSEYGKKVIQWYHILKKLF